MTEALFLADLHSPQVGDTVTVDGDEGRHAAAVRRIRVGETIMVADGAGTGVRRNATSMLPSARPSRCAPLNTAGCSSSRTSGNRSR